MKGLIKRLTYGGAVCAVALAFLFAAGSAFAAECPPGFFTFVGAVGGADRNGDGVVCFHGTLGGDPNSFIFIDNNNNIP